MSTVGPGHCAGIGHTRARAHPRPARSAVWLARGRRALRRQPARRPGGARTPGAGDGSGETSWRRPAVPVGFFIRFPPHVSVVHRWGRDVRCQRRRFHGRSARRLTGRRASAPSTLFVEDLAATRDFYREVFGLPVVFGARDDSAVFRFGDTLVNLLTFDAAARAYSNLRAWRLPMRGPARSPRSRSMTWTAMCVELGRTRGVVLLNGPIDRPWGVRTACFADPGGHIWQIS